MYGFFANVNWLLSSLYTTVIFAMSKAWSFSSPKLNVEDRDEATQKEINRQHALLSTDADKKQLRGNVVMEDWRHYRQATSLTQKEKREHYQIKSKKKELLDGIKKVHSSYTGYYDDTKSPLENIQLALRAKCLTPRSSSRLDVRGHAIRRCKSSEVLYSPSTRASSSLSYSSKPHFLSRENMVQHQRKLGRPKTASPVISSPKRQDNPDPTANKTKPSTKHKT